ncbi:MULTISPECIES: 23S rRNA (guanosine(2251)-2'-O)-methyltransferase RlmB [unclassified Pseudofrankia]|uniref:23S rRNA (guanosine(2251)-2'-O)-methyltransferase RlmB n=1 Tax=unclassified Pseudofrankia TaxID=2994372 RepID=UPI0008D998C7|nr:MULTISPECIES: 23S rRNA (guanosine(2251)-2'-O)-methyltransferase RlmB [unclassified Pseudofrankia]MDT3441709.1 23S rRNA (guanosine(2251)-2'-O)-methyltransferase RlmB [Pseudofrankia sp. BMG5.37]OHV47161.1 23S rRNA (guanosine(2251)-2'-O)-methyltransferase RlmB [Pseudofrankia sp. BMG5.36]
MATGRRGGGGGGVARGGQGGRAAKAGSHRKGAAAGSGGLGRRALSGKGATPPAEMRKGHPAQRRANAAARADDAGTRTGTAGARTGRDGAASRGAAGGASAAGAAARGMSGRRAGEADEFVVGRNAVVEALRAAVPATTLYVAGGLDFDERLAEARKLAGRAGMSVVDVGRAELDRLCGVAPHQGLALVIPPYRYAHPDDLLKRARAASPGLLVALDGVTDPRNLGAVARSAAAFGAQGVVVPERRAAGMTAAAWKTSAGAAARLPVARATNMTRTLRSFADGGLVVVGLAADADVSLDDLEAATDPLVLVIGSEGRGLSRLVGETCDLLVRIPMAGEVESLNAGVAAGVALAEIARRRRVSSPTG